MTGPVSRSVAALCVVAWVILSVTPVHGEHAPVERARRGDELLNLGEYENAIEEYERALAAGFETAALHFNIGFAFAHTEELGLSTYHLTQAHFLAPRVSDFQDSLALIRAEAERERAEASVGEVTMGEPAAVGWLDFFVRFSRGEIELLILVTMWLSFSLLFVRRRMAPSGRRDAAAVAAVLLFVLLFVAGAYRIGAEITGSTVPGVVVTEDPTVREGPDRHAASVADSGLSIGSVVVVLEERGEWASVQLPDERLGWLHRDVVRTVRLRR